LIADLNTFRLEEYSNKLREKKKLHNIFSELKVKYKLSNNGKRMKKKLIKWKIQLFL